MTSAEINIKEELISEIKSKISNMTGDCRGTLIYLTDVSFKASSKRGKNDKLSISCLFMNEEGNICADMFRSGTAGCVDFICGLMIDSFEDRILEEIISSLDRNMWHISDSIDELRKKKKNIANSLKKSFFKKGA